MPAPKYLKDKLAAGMWILRGTGTAAGPDTPAKPQMLALRYQEPVVTFYDSADSLRMDTVSLQVADTTETKATMTLKDGKQYKIEFIPGFMFKLSPVPAPDGAYQLFSQPFTD